MSPQGERVVLLAMVAGLLALLELGLVVLGAPAIVTPWPPVLVLALAAVFSADLRFVCRHGWWELPRRDDPDGGSDGEPGGPQPIDPSGGVSPIDWEAFTAEFWRHVGERAAAAEGDQTPPEPAPATTARF